MSIHFFFQIIPVSTYACMGLIGGIALASFISFSGLIIGATTLGVSLFLLQNIPAIPLKQLMALLVFFLIGYGRITYQIYPYHTFPFDSYFKPQSLTGHITNINYGSNKRFPKCITLFIPSMNISIQIYTKKNSPGTVGDTITVHHVPLKKTNNDSYNDYLLKEGILCSLFIENPNFTIEHHPPYCISRTIYEFKEYLLRAIQLKCSHKTFCLFSALFLGEKSRYKNSLEPLSEQFKEWGIVHFLARSGLHLVIFILLWELLFAFIPISFSYKQYFLFLITSIYFILSWPSVSFMRALVLFIITKCCILQYRPSHFLHTLAATCCIILISNPMQLFFLDFQLTFSLTAALAWLCLK